MTNDESHPEIVPLEAFLDGGLSANERAELSQQIGIRPDLQAAVSLQERIDESLRKRFAAPPPPAELLAKIRASASAKPTAKFWRRPRVRLVAAAAAAVVVWAVLGWQFFAKHSSTPTYDPNLPLANIYQKCVADGFRPTWVCKDDAEFASTFSSRQGQGLLLAAMPDGLKMEGLTYCGGLSRYTTTMLARVHDSPVMVFVDRASADSHPQPPAPQTGLHLFRQELGPLVLYELTPLDQPLVMDYLHLAESEHCH